ncbi:MAG: hypothetical protein NVSMB25_08580 [Thermoleophilaceae bacterium]
MRIALVDPPAYTPPYDHALAGALVRAGQDVTLLTSRFSYGPVPREPGYEVSEPFYRRSSRLAPGSRARTTARLVEHIPGMLRARRTAERAEIVHYQWLAVPSVDGHLLARGRPLVMTAHDVLPREPKPGQLEATRRLLARMDAVIVHSRHGRDRLLAEAGAPAERIHVIPHGALDHLTRLPQEDPLPAELARVEGPVILFFGLLRPYKGLDVLLRAFRAVPGAELWIVGMPRMALPPLEALAGPRVRFVPRFLEDREVPAYFRRADLVVLPYRETEQSGVLATALAFAKPVVASAVGGFTELADAVKLVAPGEPEALAAAMRDLLADEGARADLASAAARAAAGPLSWARVARETVAVYEGLLGGPVRSSPP